MGLSTVFVGFFALCAVVVSGTPYHFYSDVLVLDEFTTDPALTRITPEISQMWYYDATTNPLILTERYERIKFSIPLPQNVTLEEFNRYEGFQIRYTVCKGACTWQDIYEEHFPHIVPYSDVGAIASSNGTMTLSLLNGTDISNVQRYDLDDEDTQLFYTSSNELISAQWSDSGWFKPNRTRRVDFVDNFSEADFDKDAIFSPELYFGGGSVSADEQLCPPVDPKCYRLDIMVVFDSSGSVSKNWGLEVQFGYNVVRNLRVEPGWTQAGYQVFGTKALIPDDPVDSGYTNSLYPEQQPLTLSQEQIKEAFWALNNNGDTSMSRPYASGALYEYTSIVDGIAKAAANMEQNARSYSNVAFLVITDGNGNRPCGYCTFNSSIVSPENMLANTYNSTRYTFPCANSGGSQFCSTSSYCTQSSGCYSLHDEVLVDLYNLLDDGSRPFWVSPPTAFAIGVGEVSQSTLLTIIRTKPNGATEAERTGDGQAFSVASFSALQSILDDVLGLFLCEIPGRAKCPKDCLPGGFCCAGGCVCAEDCSANSTECQERLCVVSQVNGTSCQFGDANNGSCYDGDSCTYDICVDGAGCTNPDIPENDPCDDGNGCTEGDVCINRVCTGSAVPNEDPSTNNSRCSDNNLCTQDYCLDGECISNTIPKLEEECSIDNNEEDCNVPYCEPTTGECAYRELQENEVCKDSDDKCTVYVCVYSNGVGECKSRTPNLSECEDNSSVAVGPIVAAIVAFLALLAAACCILLLLILLIAMLVVMARSGAEAAVIIGGFAGNIDAINNPTFVEATTFTTNALNE
jgi:hypothetical protein